MVEDVFSGLPLLYQSGKVTTPLCYYFSLGDSRKTVKLSPESCLVEEGKTVETADCVCKTSEKFFLKIWQDGYRPGLKDFMSGTIKSNKPDLLKTFLEAFGKQA